MDCSWEELVWAAISVGKGELSHLVRWGAFSLFEIIYRSAILYANLMESPNSDIVRSEAYDGLDPSEKGAISYFLGLTLSKLVSQRLLNVPWLMHLDVYREDLGVWLTSKTRPDLVGRTWAGEWIVLESKGRTNGYDGTALDKAKEQVEVPITIRGQEPSLRVACLTHFDGGTLNLAIRDPERRRGNEKPIDLPLTHEKLLVAYYRPFEQWLEQAETEPLEIEAGRFRVASIRDVDVSVGLRIERVQRGLDRPSGLVFQREQRYFVGQDGVLVHLGPLWSPENMHSQPQTRHR